MKVQLISDLHFEHNFDGGRAFATKELQVAGDVLVLAGDVQNLTSWKSVRETLGWFCARWDHVLYVPGNHEYYGTKPDEADARLARAAEEWPNLHALNPGVAEIGGHRFVGATMWFPEEPGEEPLRRYLSDFKLIDGFVSWVRAAHLSQLTFLRDNTRPGDVVVTHHMPHPNSTPAQFKRSAINRFFVAEDALDCLLYNKPKIWMHGHTHNPCDYVVADTRVVCNPRGYPGEKWTPPVKLDFSIDLD